MESIIESPINYFNKALDLVKENNLTEAFTMLNKSLALNGEDMDVLNLSGLCSFLLCQFEIANSFWIKSLTIQLENNKALNYLENMHSEEFQEIINKYNKAIDCMLKEKYLEASTYLEDIVKARDSLIEPNIVLGLCYLELGDRACAKKYFLKAHELDKGNKKIEMYLIEVEEKTIKNMNSKNKRVLLYMGIAISLCGLLGLGYGAKAKQNAEYKKEISKYTQISEEALKQRENFALENKELHDKIEELSKNLEIVIEKNMEIPQKEVLTLGNEQEVFNEATLNLKNKKYNDAIEGFTKIKKFSVTDYLVAEATYLLAKSYELSQEYNKAMETYNEYSTSYKGRNYYDESLYSLGMLHYKLGDIKSSQNVLEKLVREVPKSIYNNSKTQYILNK